MCLAFLSGCVSPCLFTHPFKKHLIRDSKHLQCHSTQLCSCIACLFFCVGVVGACSQHKTAAALGVNVWDFTIDGPFAFVSGSGAGLSKCDYSGGLLVLLCGVCFCSPLHFVEAVSSRLVAFPLRRLLCQTHMLHASLFGHVALVLSPQWFVWLLRVHVLCWVGLRLLLHLVTSRYEHTHTRVHTQTLVHLCVSFSFTRVHSAYSDFCKKAYSETCVNTLEGKISSP